MSTPVKKRVHFAEDLERTPSPSYSNSPPQSPGPVTPPMLPAGRYSPLTHPSSPYLTASPTSSRRAHVRTPSPLSLPATAVIISHPVLSSTTHPDPRTNIPSFIWDVTLPLETITQAPFSTPPTVSLQTVMREPATRPGLHEIVIRVEDFPWKIVVKPYRPTPAHPYPEVTVYDVLYALSANLNLPVLRSEYSQLPDHLRPGVDRAYYARCDRILSQRDRDEEIRRGVRRVDFLAGRTTFKGLRPGGKQGEFIARFS
ncbi:hypothetical protein NLI96_g4071 [Meripilus lineatus]|uniref:DUF6699 domain-containing protein n=1 Tax=Meripilus lineatus TaxID=2056292 RepID=A0AAD5V7M7_9APHY|nr:hypothetical protein NLI96_g4071 [Physisporinus lineatus]